MYIIGYYVITGVGKHKIIIEEFLEGAKRFGHSVKSFRIGNKPRLHINNADLCVSIGWRKSTCDTVLQYKNRITIHDA